jgi:hypothetical protein
MSPVWKPKKVLQRVLCFTGNPYLLGVHIWRVPQPLAVISSCCLVFDDRATSWKAPVDVVILKT